MDREQQRRDAQLAFLQSGQDIVIGDAKQLPLSIAQLQNSGIDCDYVRDYFADGLTAQVFKLQAGGSAWTLKLKREQSLVKNIDGQTSFLNEVQRRRDFHQLKNDSSKATLFQHVVDTEYASFQQGILLSPWIEGEILQTFNERVLTQLFSALVQFELHGFMEWDLCSGNILDDGKNVHLFDFGYCYRFDPLTEFNSNGIKDPLFHCAERLETRNFFAHLLNLQSTSGEKAAFALFELEKRLALQAYQFKLSELKRRGARQTILDWTEGIIKRWQAALQSRANLEDLFVIEGYRSHLIDLYDDLHGQSCTAMTLKRVDVIESILTEQFDLLAKNNGLFFGDEEKTQQQLLARIKLHRQQAIQFQLSAQR